MVGHETNYMLSMTVLSWDSLRRSIAARYMLDMTACCIPPLNVTTLSTTPTNVPGVRCGSRNNWVVNTHGRVGTCGGYSRLLFYALVYLLTNAVSSVAAPLQSSIATLLKTPIFPYFGSSQKREDGVNLFSPAQPALGGLFLRDTGWITGVERPLGLDTGL